MTSFPRRCVDGQHVFVATGWFHLRYQVDGWSGYLGYIVK